MMPSSTPRVPFKYPGMETPQWIDIYNRMYRERIMFLNQPISDNLANNIIAVLLYLESEDATSPVSMYCNVMGGRTKAGLALHDTMRIMPYEIQTVNMGMCAQVAAFLVAGGTEGKRFALPNSRFAMQSPILMPPFDNEGKPIMRPMQATEMKLEVEEVCAARPRHAAQGSLPLALYHALSAAPTPLHLSAFTGAHHRLLFSGRCRGL